jgi:hypothetical protein
MAANRENLVRNSDLTPQERREKASKAGKASVEARRKKKTMKEVLEYMLHNSELKPALKQMLADEGIDENEMNHQMVITRSLIAKAEQGDVQAYNTICAMIGEKPADKLDLSGSLDSKIEIGFVETGIDPASDESEVDVG